MNGRPNGTAIRGGRTGEKASIPVPRTSTTMLRQIAGAADHPRWGEFVARYLPAMQAYARERFPALDADDLVQETLLGVMKALPDYVAREEKPGAFHNFLAGVLRHKALDALREDAHHAELKRRAAKAAEPPDEDPALEAEWRRAVLDVALGALLADPRFGARSKQIFLRTAVRGEKPQDVAAALLTTRSAVDQMKKRMTARLRELIGRLENIGGI
jgi:RNA polymerase sigma factor (sigma-70 family)